MAGDLQLSIDTSTAYAGLAVSRAGTLLVEYTWRADRDHSRTLMPAVVRLLELHRWTAADLGSLAIALGPGSFNGLRVGVSAVKGLALALGLPVVGVSTLAVAAYAHAVSGLPVCAVHDAGRKELAAAVYQLQDGRFARLMEEQIIAPEALAAGITETTVVAGDVPAWAEPALRDQLGTRGVFVLPALALRRPAALADLAWRRLDAGDHDDAAALQPLYLRRPPITQPRTPAAVLRTDV